MLFVASTITMSLPNVSEPNSSNPSHDEYQYLNLIRDVMNTGATRPDRTGTGTISIFAPPSLRFSLANNTLPLLTTKRVFTRGVLEELLWFVRGDTDGGALAARDVHIWDGNGSRAFLDSRGLTHRKEGDLGPVYGFQWRHFGAEYVDAWADYKGKGVDQLQDVIRKITHDPTDRRIIMSAWNPAGKYNITFYCSSLIRFTPRLISHGPSSLPYVLSILRPPCRPQRSRSQERPLLSHVPTFG